MRIVMILLVLLPVSGVRAFSLSPTVASFSPSSDPVILKLDNPSTEKVALQIEIFERLTRDGAEVREKTSLLSLSPEQFVLGPGETRRLPLKWVGPATLASEKAFRVVVTQLPVFLPAGSAAGPKVIVRIVGSVLVGPKVETSARF